MGSSDDEEDRHDAASDGATDLVDIYDTSRRKENVGGAEVSFSEWLGRRTTRLTIIYCWGFLCLGLILASIGPSLLELGRRSNSSVSTMSFVVFARSLGYLLGSAVGGPLFDVMDGHRLLACGLALTGAAVFFIPFVRSFALLCLLVWTQGLSMGLLDSGGNVMLLWLLKEEPVLVKKSDPYMQSLHFCFGVGAFISPILIGEVMHHHDNDLKRSYFAIGAMFVPVVICLLRTRSPSPPPVTSVDSDTLSSSSLPLVHPGSLDSSAPHDPSSDQDHLEMDPFTAETASTSHTHDAVPTRSASSSSCGGLHHLTHVWHSYTTHLKSMNPILRSVLFLNATFLFLYVGAEVSAGAYIYAYAVKEGLASERHAAMINAAFWGSLAFGRLVAIPLSTRLSAENMVRVNLGGCLASLLLILSIASSVHVLWAGVILYGFFMASMFPTAMVLADQYMGSVGGQAAAFFVMGASMGEMVIPVTTGFLLTEVSYKSLFLSLLGAAVLGWVVFVLLRRQGKKAQNIHVVLDSDV